MHGQYQYRSTPNIEYVKIYHRYAEKRSIFFKVALDAKGYSQDGTKQRI